MKVKKSDRAKALEKLKRDGYNEHEALALWLKMSNKEQRKFVAGMKG